MSGAATPADVLACAAPWACLVGDVRETLRTLPDESVQCVVTSPPYWGLRDYGRAGQIGMEPTPAEYVETMRALFAEIRRVLRPDGVCFLNLGDSYASDVKGSGGRGKSGLMRDGRDESQRVVTADRSIDHQAFVARRVKHGLKPKDLVGIPWRVAFALQDDGWWLRSDIIWSKPNPMPESVTDRPTRAHEYVFLLTKSARYFYDAEAVREPYSGIPYAGTDNGATPTGDRNDKGKKCGMSNPAGRNARSVWTITPEPYAGAHFATMPPELARRCILAGSRKGDVILDPFGGSGTTALVAVGHGRRAILCELNEQYAALQLERLAAVDSDVTQPVRVDDGASFGPLFGGAA